MEIIRIPDFVSLWFHSSLLLPKLCGDTDGLWGFSWLVPAFDHPVMSTERQRAPCSVFPVLWPLPRKEVTLNFSRWIFYAQTYITPREIDLLPLSEWVTCCWEDMYIERSHHHVTVKEQCSLLIRRAVKLQCGLKTRQSIFLHNQTLLNVKQDLQRCTSCFSCLFLWHHSFWAASSAHSLLSTRWQSDKDERHSVSADLMCEHTVVW